jgi:asparagine synthase (glutamine-hydrolysing)
MVSADEIPQVLDEYISLMGEPNCNPSGLSMMSLYERAKSDGQRLMLTGDGADELFFGYDRYKIINSASKLRWIFPILKTPILREISTLKTLFSAQLDNFNDWAFWHQSFSAEEIETLFGFSKNDIRNSRTTLENTWNEVLCSRNKDKASFMMELDRRLWLIMESNKRLDRVSMAYSIEARCPFQDSNIIELTSNANLKGGVGKHLAKADLIRAFPELDDLRVQERKVGFISPLGNWIRVNKKYVEENLTYLAETGFMVREFHNIIETQEGLANGDFSTLRKMWTLLVVSRWLQRVTDG